MIKTIKICDICGQEGKVHSFELPMFRTFDACDGRTFYDQPMIVTAPVDICPECLSKCTNIHDERVMGYGTISIQVNPMLKEK